MGSGGSAARAACKPCGVAAVGSEASKRWPAMVVVVVVVAVVGGGRDSCCWCC